jgi:hypothetical protein
MRLQEFRLESCDQTSYRSIRNPVEQLEIPLSEIQAASYAEVTVQLMEVFCVGRLNHVKATLVCRSERLLKQISGPRRFRR